MSSVCDLQNSPVCIFAVRERLIADNKCVGTRCRSSVASASHPSNMDAVSLFNINMRHCNNKLGGLARFIGATITRNRSRGRITFCMASGRRTRLIKTIRRIVANDVFAIFNKQSPLNVIGFAIARIRAWVINRVHLIFATTKYNSFSS